jgi:hypothetical protein
MSKAKCARNMVGVDRHYAIALSAHGTNSGGIEQASGAFRAAIIYRYPPALLAGHLVMAVASKSCTCDRMPVSYWCPPV